MGGSVNNEQATSASKNADLYDPATNTFSSAGANASPRLYHSGSLLLPDATVMLVGGNPTRGDVSGRHRNLFACLSLPGRRYSGVAADDTSVTPAPIGYGQTFQIQTPDAAAVQSVVLVRPGAQTHAFDMDQRLVRMSVYQRKRHVERHRASDRKRRASRPLHAVHSEFGRRAVAREVRPVDAGWQRGADCHDQHAGGEHHHQPG